MPAAGILLPTVLLSWQLQQQGALLSSALAAFGGAAMASGLWRLLGAAGGRVRCLQLCPDGQVLLYVGPAAQPAWLEPCSLRIGSHLLLVFRTTGRRRLRLLLGPGNLSADDLAALRRWLQRAPGRDGTGSGVLG